MTPAIMTEDQIRKILEEYRAGALSPDDALHRLRSLPFEDLGFANIDHHRTLRQGFPEVIFGMGKTVDQVAKIVESMHKHDHNILITRTTPAHFERVKQIAPEAEFHEGARAIVIQKDATILGKGGLHRLLDRRERLAKARVVIVVAGMEGALPSVVGGLVSVPVIAVPTSVGYGASFNGVAALLGMLNSCASNVSVVNIDNGYGAAVVASLINRL